MTKRSFNNTPYRKLSLNWKEDLDRPNCFNQNSEDWILNGMTKPAAYHGWTKKKVFRCRCSKIASALILNLFLRVKILHLAHREFTFLLFRSNCSCLFSHFNDFALTITKLQIHRRMVDIALWTAMP